ncbi:MAG: HDOD domain-containing protein, partial [Bdellovibrionales bacterium]|nr:HDOD domain-containing protein [Bdellovibrionales bacterium]
MEKNFSEQPERVNLYLQDGYRYVLNGWLPANPIIVSHVQQSFNENKYLSNPKQLISDIKKDPGLLMHCVRFIIEKNCIDKNSKTLNPIELLRNAPLDLVREAVSTGASSMHTYNQSMTSQVSLTEEALLTATSVEFLAEELDIDCDLAYTTALFKQIGGILIAWNYPHIYQRALEMADTGESLDLQLTKMLGFSRATLAYTLAKKWNIIPEVRLGIGDRNLDLSNQENVEQLQKTSEKLQKICRIGEALVKASLTDKYPNALQDWEVVKVEFLETLDQNAINILKNRLADASKKFLCSANSLMEKVNSIIDTPVRSRKNTSLKLANNLYLLQCEKPLKGMLEKLYEKIRNRMNAHDCLEFLLKEVIPLSGFSRSCIYILSPEEGSLVPLSTIGIFKESELQAITPSSDETYTSLISEAYRSRNIVIEEEGNLNRFAAVLGEMQKAGVLFLEANLE